MIDLNHPLWNTLSSAGPNTAELLKKLTRNEGDFYDTVDILAENLSHQLSWYDVTAYALPHLARLCRTLDVEKKLYLIANTGAAVAAARRAAGGFSSAAPIWAPRPPQVDRQATARPFCPARRPVVLISCTVKTKGNVKT